MGESIIPPNSNPEKSSLCEECGSNPWKYRCPGCSILTCSLPCVKAHKERTSCTGKRNRTEFVPLFKFDDNLLLSDYNLLEETKRLAESAHRTIAAFGSTSNIMSYLKKNNRNTMGFKSLHRYRMLWNAACRRNIRLLILPGGMSKREKNNTRFNQWQNCIYWTVEWRFHSTDVVLVDHDVKECTNLSSIIEKHLAPSPWRSQLTPFCNTDLDDLKFFIQKNAKGTKSIYHKLNIRLPLAKQLKNTVIVEYPVIHVFLPSEIHDFKVEGKYSFAKNEETPLSASGISSPKGTLFREEEIEEGELPSDTQVLDLTDCRILEPCRQPHINRAATICTKEDCQPDKKMRILVKSKEPSSTVKHQATTEETTAHVAGVVPTMLAEDDNFDFEQDVKDAYSDLIGEIDPDEFLCFDGGFSGEDGDDPLYFGGNFFGDELEEGEIPSY